VELPTLQAIKRFVSMGNGVALVPEISVENEISRGELMLVKVRDLHFQRKLRVVHRQESGLSHAGRAFLKVAEQIAKDRGGRYRFQREK
jgi:DNA-binding transcriptional LysR family regulator